MNLIKRTFPCLLCCLFIIIIAPGSGFSQTEKYEVILGVWDVETDGMSYTFVFDFRIEGDSLVGTYISSSGDEIPMEDLTFEKNTLSFSVTVSMGPQSMLIDFSATVKGEELTGGLSMEYGDADITGIRRKKK
ncbi:hypothetical protein ACFL6G_04680 [candidate division KSB1 bacterium]